MILCQRVNRICKHQQSKREGQMRIWEGWSDEKAEHDSGSGLFYARSKKEIMRTIKLHDWHLERCSYRLLEVQPNKDGIIKILNQSHN